MSPRTPAAERDPDRDRGVYRKFKVTRTDGSHRKGRKHADCTYFVLDLEHDEFARAALKAYEKACRQKYPELADDLRYLLSRRPCGCRSIDECMHRGGAQTMNDAMQEKLVDG